MSRRIFLIGLLVLAASGCALPATPSVLTTDPAQNLNAASASGFAPSVVPIPTSDPAPSAAPIAPVQATSPHKKREPLTTEPPLTTPPPMSFTTVAKTDIEKVPPTPIDKPIVEAFRCIVEGRHAEADSYLQAYGPVTRDVFLQMLPAVALLSNKKVEDLSPDEVVGLTQTLDAIAAGLRPRAALSISKLCFCDAVSGYLMYRPLAEDHAFLAAHGDRPGELVQLYLEMKNLGSRPEGAQFVTDLACEIEIVDDAGRPRWTHRFRPEDLRLASRSPLREYYHNFSFYLPTGLTPGRYRLNLRLADRTQPEVPRETATAIPLRIVGDR